MFYITFNLIGNTQAAINAAIESGIRCVVVFREADNDVNVKIHAEREDEFTHLCELNNVSYELLD